MAIEDWQPANGNLVEPWQAREESQWALRISVPISVACDLGSIAMSLPAPVSVRINVLKNRGDPLFYMLPYAFPPIPLLSNSPYHLMKPVGGAPQVNRVIRPRHGLQAINFAELWRYRELFLFLAWRDILIRYKQTALGIAWAVLQPFLTMIIFSVVFGRLAKLPSNGVPYPLLTFAALLPWQFFANALSESSNSLVAASNMISKVYFPRLIIPGSSVLSGIVDFAISLSILIGLMFWYGVSFSPRFMLLPFFFLVAASAAFGVGLWLGALNVKYRDVKYIVPFFTRMGLYVCPVGFLSSVVPERWRLLYSLNPMVGVIDGFRWCILGGNFRPYWTGFAASLAITMTILVSGLLFFRSTEKRFADVI